MSCLVVSYCPAVACLLLFGFPFFRLLFLGLLSCVSHIGILDFVVRGLRPAFKDAGETINFSFCCAKTRRAFNSLPFSSVRKMDFKN